MLKVNADGDYMMTEKSVATGPIPVASLAVRNFHRQMSSLALETLDTIPTSERNFSALTLGIIQLFPLTYSKEEKNET